MKAKWWSLEKSVLTLNSFPNVVSACGILRVGDTGQPKAPLPRGLGETPRSCGPGPWGAEWQCACGRDGFPSSRLVLQLPAAGQMRQELQIDFVPLCSPCLSAGPPRRRPTARMLPGSGSRSHPEKQIGAQLPWLLLSESSRKQCRCLESQAVHTLTQVACSSGLRWVEN